MDTQAFEPVVVGVSPAGVQWVAYAPEHVEPLRQRLAHVRRSQRLTVKLTSTQHLVVGEVLGIFAEAGLDVARAILSDGSLTAPRWLLEDVASRVEGEISSTKEIGVDLHGTWSEVRERFAIRSRVRSLELLRRRLLKGN